MSAVTEESIARVLEFGEYLAKAAEEYQVARNMGSDIRTDASRRLDSAVYEFRKRAEKAHAVLALLPAPLRWGREQEMQKLIEELERKVDSQAKLKRQNLARAKWAEAEVARIRAENDLFRHALEIIAGKQQCTDNLMSNTEVAIRALNSWEEVQ